MSDDVTDRKFVCDIEPRGDGGWEIWISEAPYRGVRTDVALRKWDRKRVGGAWTSRRLVGRCPTAYLAGLTARRAIRHALRAAAADDREARVWQANARRPAFQVTAPIPTTEAKEAER